MKLHEFLKQFEGLDPELEVRGYPENKNFPKDWTDIAYYPLIDVEYSQYSSKFNKRYIFLC